LVPQNDAEVGCSFCGLFFGNLAAARVASFLDAQCAEGFFFGAERVRINKTLRNMASYQSVVGSISGRQSR
jgi:hypothetical protein